MKLEIIVAMTLNGVIGLNDSLLWNIPEDLKQYKKLTSNHVCIVGHNTFLSLPEKAFSGHRKYFVVTNDNDLIGKIERKNTCVIYYFDTIEAVIMYCDISCDYDEVVYVIGGQRIYELMLENDYCHKCLVTYVTSPNNNTEFYNGNKFFPIYLLARDFIEIKTSDWQTSKTGLQYVFKEYERFNKEWLNGSEEG